MTTTFTYTQLICSRSKCALLGGRAFNGRYPISTALSMALRTRLIPARRVKVSNRCGWSVSRLILSAFNPAAFKSGSFFSRTMPFVVIATVLTPSIDARDRTMSTISDRMVGSPPVKRIFSMPQRTNKRACPANSLRTPSSREYRAPVAQPLLW